VVVELLLIQWIGSLDVVVDQIGWKNSPVANWQVELGDLLYLRLGLLVHLRLGIVNVENRPSKSGAHLTAVVMVHAQTSSLGEAEVLVAELAETAGREDTSICGLEVLVNNETTVVDQAIVVNGAEHILVDVAMATSYQKAALKLHFVSFAFLLFFFGLFFTFSLIVKFRIIHGTSAHFFHFLLVLLFILLVFVIFFFLI